MYENYSDNDLIAALDITSPGMGPAVKEIHKRLTSYKDEIKVLQSHIEDLRTKVQELDMLLWIFQTEDSRK